jgi:hypothetical protein
VKKQGMKKIMSFLMILPVFFMVMPADAANYGLSKAAESANYDTKSDVYSMVQLAVNMLLGILAIAFFLLITYAGLKWMTARGNQEVVSQAKGTVEAAIVGLVIVMAAFAITTFIFGQLNK